MKPEYPDRIPYDAWINSQLSIARHYGGITLQGKSYFIEPDTNDLVHHAPKPKVKKTKSNQLNLCQTNLKELERLP